MGRRHLLCLIVASAGPLQMVDTASAAHLDPFAVHVPVDALKYQSAFEGYRPFAEENIKPWRESNELARRLGGWSAFAGGKTPEVGASGTKTDAKPGSAPAGKPEPDGTHSSHAPR